MEQIKTEVEKNETSAIPQREAYPIIINPKLADYYIQTGEEQEQFRQSEINLLAEQINELPFNNFREIREGEALRLRRYYKAFSTLFGVDLSAVGTSRMQLSETVMVSSPLLLQTMFDEDQETVKVDQVFFQSRIEAGGFKFNATSRNTIEGHPMWFSVLKMERSDKFGKFEVNFPAVSLPRDVLAALDLYNRTQNDGKPLNENPLVKMMADSFAYRVHDWFHSTILYDTQANTKIFKKWSDNSFFVKHLFEDPFMINYEFMADKIHYLVWQEIFKENPGTRQEVIDGAKKYLQEIAKFEEWANSKDPQKTEDNRKMADFLAYVGLRGMFNIIPFDDPDLLEAVKEFPRYQKIVELFPAKYKPYLEKVYEKIEADIPFRMGSDKRLSLEQILQEYADSLEAEAGHEKDMSVAGAWARESLTETGNVLDDLPQKIHDIYRDIDLTDKDPRALRSLNNTFKEIGKKYGSEVMNELIERIDVDDNGYFYLRVDKDELDYSVEADWKEVRHSKAGLLVQLPWDYKSEGIDITLESAESLIAGHVRAKNKVHPGDIILINTDDAFLAKRLISEGSENGRFSFDKFWTAVQRAKLRGQSNLADVYVYPTDKVDKVFKLGDKFNIGEQGQPTLEVGYYPTHVSKRFAVAVNGPVSVDGTTKTERRRIFSGAIAQSNVVNQGIPDSFPVDARSFDRFYSGTTRDNLSSLRIDPTKIKNANTNDALNDLLQGLDFTNMVLLHGFRGKPQKVTIGSLETNRK